MGGCSFELLRRHSYIRGKLYWYLDTAEYIKMLGGITPGTGPRKLEELPMLDDEIHGRELQTAANIDWTA